MQVDGVGEVQLYDGGGFPVVWVDGVGVQQDPSQGGTLVYGPDSVFWDQPDQSGNIYQLGADFHIRPFGTPAPAAGSTHNPATNPAPNAPAAQAPPQQIIVNVGDAFTKALAAAGGNTTNTTNRPAGAGSGNQAAQTGANLGKGVGGIGGILGQSITLGSGPNAFHVPMYVPLIGLGALALRHKRRR